ncbi:MAG: FAD:protein FMN transferase [Flavobacterium sp.]|nr:MAG: FAD:protein FMN transferase [Flavobacterium sp.]
MKQFAILLISLLAIVSCDKGPRAPEVLNGEAFGTTYTIYYFPADEFDAIKGVDSVIHAVNRSVSTYMPQSDISKINKGDSTLVVDKIFKEVFILSEEVFMASEGYFDPTIGVLRNAYGFGDVKPLTEINEVTLDSLLTYVGFDKVTLTSEGTVKKQRPEIYFDFNAVAKGYGIDQLGAFLNSRGVTDYLIELGGEILAAGSNTYKGQAWVVGVESVDSQLEDRGYDALVKLTNEAMASSGNYRKFRIDPATGKKYVHTIDPLTGLAKESDLTSATVIASTCATADAYATAFMAMGLERSTSLLENSEELEAYLTYLDTTGAAAVYMTDGFRKKLKKD